MKYEATIVLATMAWVQKLRATDRTAPFSPDDDAAFTFLLWALDNQLPACAGCQGSGMGGTGTDDEVALLVIRCDVLRAPLVAPLCRQCVADGAQKAADAIMHRLDQEKVPITMVRKKPHQDRNNG